MLIYFYRNLIKGRCILKNVSLKNIQKDIVSGIIVALVSIPISMGYAQIAGLPAVYGLYCSILPVLIYGLVTTDKVYRNNEWEWGYRETDELDGYDPYSNSKSCSELVTHSYEKAFLKELGIAVSTARAGNVIGGGDFAADRIVPDCVRAIADGKKIAVRNPHSTRPYQHVLEPLGAYLMIAGSQYEDTSRAGAYNVGPGDDDCITTGTLADLFCEAWGEGASWENLCQGGPHEANFLKLDCSRIRSTFGWKPHWQVKEAISQTVKWYQAWLDGDDMAAFTDRQIEEYLTQNR